MNPNFDNWELYAAGYKRAGDVLVQHVIDKRDDRDTLVFPIGFNYRQYVELRCKEIIIVGRTLAGEEPGFPRSHDIKMLWKLCREILADQEPSASTEDLEAIDEAIGQFCLVDPKSETFRYPVDREGNRSLPDTLSVINLRNLRDVMDRVASFFDSVTMAFSVYMDHLSELRSEYLSEMRSEYYGAEY